VFRRASECLADFADDQEPVALRLGPLPGNSGDIESTYETSGTLTEVREQVRRWQARYRQAAYRRAT